MTAAPPARRTFHGRRHGKALSPAQRRALAEMLPRIGLPVLGGGEARGRQRLDLRRHLPRARAFWLEIGFGAGEHLHALARAHPEVGLVGCEPFFNGVAALACKVAADDPGNLRIHPGDVHDLLEVLPAGVLDRVYLLYPDPWPKARHHKRRLANPATLEPLARAMAPDAELRLATDIPGYAAHAAAAVAATGAFLPVVAGPPGWHAPWPGWTATRYEAKALREGRTPHYLVWRRR